MVVIRAKQVSLPSTSTQHLGHSQTLRDGRKEVPRRRPRHCPQRGPRVTFTRLFSTQWREKNGEIWGRAESVRLAGLTFLNCPLTPVRLLLPPLPGGGTGAQLSDVPVVTASGGPQAWLSTAGA